MSQHFFVMEKNKGASLQHNDSSHCLENFWAVGTVISWGISESTGKTSGSFLIERFFNTTVLFLVLAAKHWTQMRRMSKWRREHGRGSQTEMQECHISHVCQGDCPPGGYRLSSRNPKEITVKSYSGSTFPQRIQFNLAQWAGFEKQEKTTWSLAADVEQQLSENWQSHRQ